MDVPDFRNPDMNMGCLSMLLPGIERLSCRGEGVYDSTTGIIPAHTGLVYSAMMRRK